MLQGVACGSVGSEGLKEVHLVGRKVLLMVYCRVMRMVDYFESFAYELGQQ